jgi:thioredoxin 1
MNRASKSIFTTELASSTQLNLHEQKQHASCIRPIKNNFVRVKINNLIIVLGLAILPYYSCQSQQSEETKKESTTYSVQTIEHLTAATFKQKIFNYEINKEWKFIGKKPVIIDFYAEWCGPCKRMAPTIAQIAEQYKGKIDVYKVNVDNEQELAAAFGISSIPSVLFIPLSNQPLMSTGLISKTDFDNTIKDFLKVN